MASTPATIESLPNEILISVLSSLSTTSLLPITAVNLRFHDLTLRILRERFSNAARLPGHNLILECYHPSAKMSTPYFHCDYLGTDGLDASSGPVPDQRLDLAALRGLYSRFRPAVQDEARRPRSRYWVRAQQQQPRPEPECPSQVINLDDGESFSQLCTLTNVGKVGPKRGVYLSHVNVSDGVIRVWRDWLAARAAEASLGREAVVDKGKEKGEIGADDPAILWADAEHNIGVRFRVVETVAGNSSQPVLIGVEEDLPVSYRLEYEELLIRTRELLLALEKSEVLEISHSGKALILFVS